MSGSNYFPPAQVAPAGQPIGGGMSSLGQALMGRPAPMPQLSAPGGGMNAAMMQMLMQNQDQGRPLGAPTTVGSNQTGYPSADAVMNAPSGLGGILPTNAQPQGIRGQLSDILGNLGAPAGTASFNTATPAAPDPSMWARLQNLFGSGGG